jgi:5'-nucleotidase
VGQYITWHELSAFAETTIFAFTGWQPMPRKNSQTMLILLTNDDGIQAPGLVALYRELIKLGDVEVVAPETVQSATGHGITLATPLLTSRVRVENTFDGTAVAGSPADCVKLAIAHLVSRTPDLVISGMNSGANTGINVVYSGTVAAAIEAAFLGLPSIAASLYLKPGVPIDYPRSAALAREAIECVLEAGMKPGRVATINIPALHSYEQPTGIRVVRQCTRPWVDTYDKRKDPRGRDYYWNSSVFTLGDTEEDTDVAALRDGYNTVTPLHYDLTQYPLLHEWKSACWSLKSPDSAAH